MGSDCACERPWRLAHSDSGSDLPRGLQQESCPSPDQGFTVSPSRPVIQSLRSSKPLLTWRSQPPLGKQQLGQVMGPHSPGLAFWGGRGRRAWEPGGLRALPAGP